jgi:NRPS condensation-like uncharacterized protein
MDLVPILRSRYVERAWHPFWESTAVGHDDVVTFVAGNCLKEEIDRFLTGRTDECQGPQLLVRIVSSQAQDALCIVMNHMICDGAGFKEYLYLLNSLYTNLRRDPDYRPEEAPGGSRSINQVYRQLRLQDRLRLLFTRKHVARHDSGLAFPLSSTGDTSPFIATHKLPRSRFRVLREYGNKYGVTINDIVLAAYLRVLSRVMEIPSGKTLIMPCAIDLRRFLSGGRAEAICNLTSTIICDIGEEIGDSFADTVIRVKQDMDVKKGYFYGLNGLIFLSILSKLVPYAKAKPFFKEKFINPVLFMTNIGVIDKSRLAFDNLSVLDAFVTGSIKYPPYFQLALTTFDEAITFSINLYGSTEDREKIDRFFRILDDELPNYSVCPDHS